MPKGGQDMKKIVVTVIGADRVGIVAGVTKELAKENINILDGTAADLLAECKGLLETGTGRYGRTGP